VADIVRAEARRLKMPGLARGFEALARQSLEERWSGGERIPLKPLQRAPEVTSPPTRPAKATEKRSINFVGVDQFQSGGSNEPYRSKSPQLAGSLLSAFIRTATR
jgi:hypothetical protein